MKKVDYIYINENLTRNTSGWFTVNYCNECNGKGYIFSKLSNIPPLECPICMGKGYLDVNTSA